LIRWIRHDAWIDLLELLLVAVLGIGLAYWTWLVLAPRAVAAPGALADAAAVQPAAQAGRDLFGESRATPRAVAPASGGLVLLGVLSGPDARGRAILAGQGSRPVSMAAGEEVSDGIVLQEVHPDHVIISRRGISERIELQRGGERAAPPPATQRIPARR
jgi:general secretion pathway protein C